MITLAEVYFSLLNPINRNMNLFLRISVLVILPFLFSQSSIAQVTFSNQGNFLGPVSGFQNTDCMVDMNGDYVDDVVRVTSSGIYIDYMDSTGSMSQDYYPMSLSNLPTWSICAGDIDANGYNDLLLGDGDAISFVYANANGTAYTEDAHPEYIFTQRGTFADIDNDGHLDAFACHDVDQSHPYRNDGFGGLTLDTSLINTADMPGNYAALWVDYDNDGDSDLYITKCRQGSSPGDPERTNLLYRNNGNGTYTEAGAAANLDDNSQSWATVFEDFDNDGDFDAFIVNHDFQNKLLVNDGSGVYTDTIAGSGINANDLGAWENAGADFDNDGNIDIFSELQDEMYWGNGDFTFTPSNLSFRKGGIGDVDNDGFLDVINGNSLWINNGNSNHWVKVTLQGVQSNRNGIGTRVEIFGSWGIQIREIRSTQSFSPMSTLNAHFGIGAETAIDSIVLHWPSGITDILVNPSSDAVHHVIEGVGVAVDDANFSEALELYPNPAQDRVAFNVEDLATSELTVHLLDMNGRMVMKKDFVDVQEKSLDLSGVAPGTYIFRLNQGDRILSQKLSITR